MRRHAQVTAILTFLVLVLAGAGWGAAAQKVTIVMRDFSYSPAKVTLQGGVPAEVTLINRGKLPHDFTIYDRPRLMMMGGNTGQEWVERTNYFHKVNVTVAGGKVRRHQGDFMELMVAAGKSATLRFIPMKKGTFEFGCLISGHYEAGQKGVLTVK
jgi:uncharacterized cupredoxin-like copper-binding protein